MSKFIDRIGEVNTNNQGLKMTIIRCSKLEGQNRVTIDIQFEDGIIIKDNYYGNFTKGAIKHPIRYEESFAYHIIEELKIDLDSIWNWENNNELGINPYEIYKSCKTKVWLYCLENEEHNYDKEGNKIGYEITCNNFYNGSRCNYCASKKIHYKDSLAYNYPQIANMIAIEENDLTFDDCYNIACYSSKKFYFKCLDCETVSDKKICLNNIVNRGYSCKICSDGFSIPEKFMANILKQLNVDFQTQLNKSDFSWCKDCKYDFYISKYNIILETHGIQHYEGRRRGRSLKEEQANDRYKKHLAKKNNIKRYYSIDCKYSDLEYMKNNIIKTLNHLFDLSNVNWELAWQESQSSLCVKAWELWNNETHDIAEISKILDLCRNTITKYLKYGVECGKCDYNIEESMKIGNLKKKGKNNCLATKVICITTKKLFYTNKEAGMYYNIKTLTNISKCCKGNRKSCGKLEDGTPLVWRYLSINHNKTLRGKDISKLHKINKKVA